MKYLFFVNRFSLTRDFVIKQDFDSLEKDGYTVQYLDLSILFNKAKKGYTLPSDLQKWNVTIEKKSAFSKYLKQYSTQAMVITFVQYIPNSAWLYLAIFKSDIPYVVAQNPTQPQLRKKGVDVKSFSVQINKLINRFYPAKLYQKPIQLFLFYRSQLIRKSACLIYSFNRDVNKSMRLLSGNNTQFVFTSSADYKAAIKTDNAPVVTGKYAVFVDQFFCHHTDFKTNHIVHHFTAEDYYPLVNSFLKRFSEVNNIPVVVAGHPRRIGDYEKDYDFPIYLNKTAELVRDAEVVLVHFSTAVSYSVIFKRPQCFVDASILDNSTVRLEIERFSEFFNAERVMMEEPVKAGAGWIDPESEYYHKYKRDFLCPQGAIDVSLRECLLEL